VLLVHLLLVQASLLRRDTPLSPPYLFFSSDRLRCWEALGRGGRVGFCFYGAEHWLAHQGGAKKGTGVDEASLTASANGAEPLLLHLAALRPTALALPPRIWNGFKYLSDAAAATAAATAVLDRVNSETVHKVDTPLAALAAGRVSAQVEPGSPQATSDSESVLAYRLLQHSSCLAEALGGRVSVVATGGAAPNPAVMAWVRRQVRTERVQRWDWIGAGSD
jgi:hypothetical protein